MAANPALRLTPEDVALLLQETSRTFALAVPLLSGRTRLSVGLAYLLFRCADTLEDAAAWSIEERKIALGAFARMLEDDGSCDHATVDDWLARGVSTHPGYRRLLATLPEILGETARDRAPPGAAAHDDEIKAIHVFLPPNARYFAFRHCVLATRLGPSGTSGKSARARCRIPRKASFWRIWQSQNLQKSPRGPFQSRRTLVHTARDPRALPRVAFSGSLRTETAPQGVGQTRFGSWFFGKARNGLSRGGAAR